MKRWLIAILFCLQTVAWAGDTANLVMKAGADFRSTLTWTVPGSGVPVDLTGNSYAAEFRSAPYPNGTLYARYSTIITDAAAGQMQLRLSRAQTTPLYNKTGVWDLKQTSADGTVAYRFGGTVKVLPPVTTP